jgi:hypothetical protein
LTKKESNVVNGDLTLQMVIREIQSHIGAIEENPSLYKDKNFDKRVEVIDFLEFHVIDPVEELLQKKPQTDQLLLLKHRAEKVKIELEEVDLDLFQKLRANIRTGAYTGKEFKNLVHEYLDFDTDDTAHQGEPGYDNLDILINGLFSLQTMPEQTKDLEPEMVYYQKTPARVVFELAEKAGLIKDDVFFDLGSGLGQVAMLVNLLTGITTRGVEFEPAFCNCAKGCAAELNLSNVTFINTDARKANYAEGTIFFMYTPFVGEMLQEVLEILRKESLQRGIKIITYGPCTALVALQSWLVFAVPKDDNIYKLAIFTSL